MACLQAIDAAAADVMGKQACDYSGGGAGQVKVYCREMKLLLMRSKCILHDARAH